MYIYIAIAILRFLKPYAPKKFLVDDIFLNVIVQSN